jgi:hypothetical protein
LRVEARRSPRAMQLKFICRMVRQNEKAIAPTSATLAANIRIATASVRRISVDMTGDPLKPNSPLMGLFRAS